MIFVPGAVAKRVHLFFPANFSPCLPGPLSSKTPVSSFVCFSPVFARNHALGGRVLKVGHLAGVPDLRVLVVERVGNVQDVAVHQRQFTWLTTSVAEKAPGNNEQWQQSSKPHSACLTIKNPKDI